MRLARGLGLAVALVFAAGSQVALAARKPPPAPVLATATLPDGHVVTLAERVGWPATVTVTRSGVTVLTVRIVSPAAALQILTDRRLEPLWAPLLASAGPGLERLRDFRLAEARRVTESGWTDIMRDNAEVSAGPKVRSALVLGDELWRAGRVEEAFKVVGDARGATPGTSDREQAEWSMTTLRLASMRAALGQPAEARAILTDGGARLPGSRYTINITVTLAALLAETGAHAEALALVNRAEAAFDAPSPDKRDKRNKIAGSNREFNWIRACALTGLGRHQEAAPLLASFVAVPTPRDRDFFVSSTVQLRQRYARCTNDVAMMAQLYRDELRERSLGAMSLITLQPQYFDVTVPADFNERVRQQPVLAPLLAERMRVLPAALVPALNNWRTPVGRWRTGRSAGSAGANAHP